MQGFGEEKKSKKDLINQKRKELYMKTRFFEDVPFIGSDKLEKKKKEDKY